MGLASKVKIYTSCITFADATPEAEFSSPERGRLALLPALRLAGLTPREDTM